MSADKEKANARAKENENKDNDLTTNPFGIHDGTHGRDHWKVAFHSIFGQMFSESRRENDNDNNDNIARQGNKNENDDDDDERTSIIGIYRT